MNKYGIVNVYKEQKKNKKTIYTSNIGLKTNNIDHITFIKECYFT